MYGWEWRSLPSSAAEWNRNPITGFRYPIADWWRVTHLDPSTGDIKDVWEPARFGWIYDLVRGYAVTRSCTGVKELIYRFENFQRACPFYRGVQWSCGQEAAIRSFALETPPPERKGILEFLGASGERIENGIHYALSQRNNHGLSEAAGLILIGLRLQDAHPKAKYWHKIGLRLILEQVEDQFAEDGWYIQHSFNYMRMALELVILVREATRNRGGCFAGNDLAKIRAAYRLLLAVMDHQTGRVPNYGANDGSHILPFSVSDHNDFRPTAVLLAASFGFPLPRALKVEKALLGWFSLPTPKNRKKKFRAL